MTIYFANRAFTILGMASTELMDGLTIVDDVKTEEIDSGTATFECKVLFDGDNRELVKNCTTAGNYLLRSANSENEFYTIIETEEDTKEQTIYIYAEDAGMDLLNEIAPAFSADEAHPIEWYVEKYTYDSGFEIGLNEIPDKTRTLSWEGEATCAARLASVATQFDNAEISYSFEVKSLTVTHKYINIHDKRGKDAGVQLRLNREVDRVLTKTSVANLCTSLYVTGGTPEGEEEPITLAGYVYDDGEDFYVTASGRLNSREALKTWSRYVSTTEPNLEENEVGHIVGSYSYDTTSQSELCNRAISELTTLREPEVNYEIELKVLPDNVAVGDTVYIVDDAGNLYLSSRILKLTTSVCDMKQTATLGEFLLKDSGITEKVAELAAQFSQIAKARTTYTWVAYADDKYGNGISLEPTETTLYLGVAINKSTATVDISDPFIFTWSLIKGADGEDGSKTYLESGTPSADNYPANEWVDASTQEKHVGDIYFDEDTGYTYRWSESNGEYSWVIIKDDDISANQQALQDALDKAMSELEQKIAALEAIVDNTIETWFEAGEPMLDNYPASEWTDDETKAKHVGDLYYDSNNGYCYRFTMNTTTGVFSWVLIQDNDVTEALSELHDAIEAQEKLTEEFNQFREETDAAIAELPTTILSEASETFATKTETAEMESSLSASIATNAAGLESLASRVDTAEDELNGISETYATKSELTQTASEISTKVSSVESVANSAIGSAVEALEKATGNEVDISNLAMILQKAGYYNLLEGTSSEWSDWYELKTTDTDNYTVLLYYGYDMSYFTEGSTLTFGFDIEFFGVEEGTAGTFKMYSQDSWYIDGGTTVWNKGPCYGAMTITSAPEDGGYHYSNTTTYTTDYSGYDYFRFSIRNNYTTGGKFRVRNVMLTPTSTEVSWAPAKADIIEALDKAAGNEVNISDLAVRMTEAESSITQNAESITLAVSEQQALQNALSDDISNLELTSDAIRLFCRQFLTDEEYDEVKDDISALFEVTAGEIMSKFSSLWITESDEGLRIGRDGSTLQSLQDNDSYEFIDTNTDTAVVTLDTTGLTATRVGAQQFELMDGSAKQWAIRKGATVSGTGSGLDIVWIGG